jgi:hypothetical protein
MGVIWFSFQFAKITVMDWLVFSPPGQYFGIIKVLPPSHPEGFRRTDLTKNSVVPLPSVFIWVFPSLPAKTKLVVGLFKSSRIVETSLTDVHRVQAGVILAITSVIAKMQLRIFTLVITCQERVYFLGG